VDSLKQGTYVEFADKPSSVHYDLKPAFYDYKPLSIRKRVEEKMNNMPVFEERKQTAQSIPTANKTTSSFARKSNT